MTKKRAPEGWITIGQADGAGWHQVRWDEDGHARVRVDKDNRVTDVWVSEPTAEKLRRVPLNRIQLAVKDYGEMIGDNITDPRYRLRRPKGRKIHATFYRNVATAYRDAVRRGLQPRKTIVADTGASDATVARWIGEARKREYLPPAEPGKVSA